MLGIEHPSGPHSLKTLAEDGHTLPEGWVRKSDHAKRGIVVAVPAPADARASLEFVLRACEQLSGVPLGLEWTAAVCKRG